MNKKYLSYGLILLSIFLVGCTSNTEQPTEQIKYEEVEELIEEVGKDQKIKGSCNTIDDSSACLDYVGTFWTEEQMKLNCGDAGTFSKNTCPYSEMGGCQSGKGTMVETIVWQYNRGGNPLTAENLPYAQRACNEGPMTNWTLPEF